MSNDIISIKELFNKKYVNRQWGENEGTRSGYGSSTTKTRYLSKLISSVLDRYETKKVVDVCGDFNWQHEFLSISSVDYIGIDISEYAIDTAINRPYSHLASEFLVLDATIDELPSGDLFLIRDILGHLTLDKGIQLVENIKNHGFKYLLTTHFEHTKSNRNIENGQFYPINWKLPPFDQYNIIENYYEAPLCEHGSNTYNKKQLVLIEF
jgi:hypothetical protein